MLATAASAAVPAAADEAVDVDVAAETDPFDVLVFSKTAGFRHGSIPAGIAAIEQLGVENGFSVDSTEDAGAFTDENLEQYEAVVWLSTTGDVLNDEQQEAFERYIGNGGGYAGVHAASDTEYDWPWYGELVGAYFASHPANQDATIKVEDSVHPSTDHLPERWERYDEWYNFRSSPRDEVHVLASLDESTYQVGSGAMGADHPIAWCHEYDGGRSWYTGGGHTNESFAEPDFLEHLLGGIRTAAGVVDSDCSATQSDSFEMVPLDQSTANPMMLDVAPDGTVFYVERDGRLRVIDPETNVTSTAMTLDVTQSNEDGLTGVVLDPDFAENGWLYLFWSPRVVGDQGPHNRVSRFDVDLSTGTADPASEETVLVIPTQRETCCHAGGDMVFDAEGNMYVATGDNTNPFESQGFTPTDERSGRQNYDAQRTSANSNDLRGKILRITPQPDGSYTVPEGNMFEAGTADTLPEIYAMGFRNPFRIGVDPATGNVHVADYGPDANSANPNRGPAGTVEWNVVSEPGFYGWPYCTGPNEDFRDYNFATGQSGAAFDCAGGAVNDSPNNTGIEQLPPAIGAEVWYGYAANPLFPEIGGGGAPMGGAVYEYDAELDSDVKWPAYWDGKAFFGEWNQGRMYSFQLTGEQRDDIVNINRVLPGILDPSEGFNRPMDFDFGPDGALYVIDWGAGFGGNNDTSGIYKVNYVKGNPAPIARASADVTSGHAPLTVQFSSEGTRHPGGEEYTLQWSFGDGSEPSSEPNPTHTYTENGAYTAQLVVTDTAGQVGVANVSIVVGNEAPSISITFPENGGFFEWGDQVLYEIEVDDPDGEVDCSDVTMFTSLGHDSHAHPFDELEGCSGSFQTARDEGHGIEANIFWVIEATYSDDGGEVGVPLTANDLQVLQPKLLQSEFYTSTGRLEGSTSGGDPGVVVETTGDSAGGGQNIGYIEPDDWWAHEPISLASVDGISLRAASPNGGQVSVRWDAPDGPEIGSIEVPATGDWQAYTLAGTELSDVPSGTGTLYFVLVSGQANVNWMEIDGRGVTDNVRPDVELTVEPTSGTAPLDVVATVVADDPDETPGDLEIAWDAGFGDGFEAGAETFEVTYDEPGTYRLQVRVTDGGGAFAVEYATIEVDRETSEPGLCFTGRSDDFLGDELDPERWDVLNRDQGLQVADGHLTLPATRSDFYGTNNEDVPNLVLQDLPEGPFTATAKLTVEANAQYQQAGLLIWDGPDDYAKMVIQGRSAPADPATRVFQFIREEGADPQEVGDSNTAALGAAYPSTVYVRLASSDGSDLNASYSADGVTFTEMPQTKSLDGLDDPQVGLFALAGSGTQADIVEAQFDWFHIVPDDTASTPGPDDEFEGDALDTCRWEVVREDPSGYRVTGGALEIDTTATDIYGTDNSDVPNIVVQDQPGDSWTVQTLVDGSALDEQYQQAGLIVYGDDDEYVKFDYVVDNAPGAEVSRRLELRSEVGGAVQNPQPGVDNLDSGTWWLRLTRDGDTFTGSYSADGEEWSTLGQTVSHAGLDDARVGLYALGGPQTASRTASFDHFRVIGDSAPLTVTGSIDPAEPDGPDGSWLGPVTVTVETDGGPEGATVYREVNVDGAGWAEYTAPVVVSEPGEHEVQIRASAGDQEVVGETVTFTIAEPETMTATPAVTVTQATCDAGGSIAGVAVDGVKGYVFHNWVDGALAGKPANLSDLAPGQYHVIATPEDGYVLELDGDWKSSPSGKATLVVTIADPECATEVTPSVEVTQATCTWAPDGTLATTGGSIVGAETEGLRYVIRPVTDDGAGAVVTDPSDLEPGTYRVAARPSDGYVVAPEGAWRVNASGIGVLVVTIDEPECPVAGSPAVVVTQPQCGDKGSIVGVPMDTVRKYDLHHWDDGKRGRKVSGSALAPGTYQVTASPGPRVSFVLSGDWEESNGRRATLLVTLEEVTCG
ncbi:ThuA domain-containing protein [Isoptericola halotolerans]|uniref:Glucose/arabinose dehydrogenase/regulation of enolase protein 1 (Concanavalin A-like superfamily) n=3 Tax=Isoptericola halotolerans TaxID=300560 RepID=A0ABX2A516_9MICO|nr:ThuA domain-containing protein [Isoptericola halotolerans]NOV97800.1 glucose/arabinose dehydrogenase/regulation of enolase protein 1 (concanavalin A-like superfamily) [Isoptericola halotolerans]